MHKPTYGTPQSIFSKQSQGLLEYIQAGKIRPVVDIPKMLHQHFARRKQSLQTLPQNTDFSDQEKTLLKCLGEVQEAEVGAIAYHFQTSIEHILPQLTMLEIKNAIYQPTPGIYKISCK